MSKIITATLIISCMTLLSGCGADGVSGLKGSGTMAKENRNLGSFHAIEIEIPAELAISAGGSPQLSIETDDNILPHVITAVKDGVLKISSDGNLNGLTKMTVDAKAPSIDRLTINGATKTHLNGLSGNAFALAANGASEITANGKVDKLAATLSGAGRLKSFELAVREATLTIDGAGNAQVNASDTLAVTVNGAGTVQYKGDPRLTQAIHGVGSITRQ